MNSRFVVALAALTCAAAGSVQAQNAKSRITVMTFQSQEKGNGAKAADELRGRLTKQFNPKDVYVLPTKDVTNTLESSGFSASDPLAPTEEKALANLLRADDYVTGQVSKSPTGAYQVNARLVVTRDNTLSQALPTATSGKVADAMDAVAKSAKDAMKQLDGEQACVNKARTGDAAGALAAARQGIAAYPNATLARLCMANVYYSQYAKATTHADSVRLADSVLTVTRVIAQQDPGSTAALRFNVELYKVRGDSTHARQALVDLIRADPTNDKLIGQVVNELAGSGHAQDAVPLVKELLARNPGDPQALRTAFLVYLAANDWQSAVTAGPELIRADTTAADSSYYVRMAAAYQALNQTPQALASLQAGTQKYPNNTTLLLAYASGLRKAGQGAQAADIVRRAVAAKPNDPQALLLLADTYAQANQPDSVAMVLQRAAMLPGADKNIISQYALVQGNNAYKAANASKDRADFQRAISLLQLSDRIQASTDAKFLTGAAAFSIAQSAANDANTQKSCQLAQTAQTNLSLAATGLQAGSSDDKYKAAATQYLTYVPQFRPAIDAQVKKFCR
ncbi:MAG: tetratricopeptide repeat protein [Gemmatimonadaceae bacterium]